MILLVQNFPQIEVAQDILNCDSNVYAKVWRLVSGIEQSDCSGRRVLVANKLGSLGFQVTKKASSNWIKLKKNVLSQVTRSPEVGLQAQ